MTQEQAKRWNKEINHWANGGRLWAYDDEDDKWRNVTEYKIDFYKDTIIVIEDKHFEARKAFALGEPIETKKTYDNFTWGIELNPTFNDAVQYRPKSKQ